MGYNLTNTGFQIVLDKDVPDSTSLIFLIFSSIPEKNNLEVEDVENFLFHPEEKDYPHG